MYFITIRQEIAVQVVVTLTLVKNGKEGKLPDIEVLDHIVRGDEEFHSIANMLK